MGLKPLQKRQVIETLAKTEGVMVFKSAFKILMNKQQAEDVAQDLFITLFEMDEKRFASVENWPAYLRRMAVTRSIDVIRKVARQKEDSFQVVDFDPVANAKQTPHETAQMDQDISQLQNSLTSLPELEAQVFVLRLIEQFAYKDIAQQLDISVNHVGVLLNRAKQSLANHYSQNNIQGESA